MKIGMNLLLWTGTVREEHFPVLEMLKSAGFDGAEIPTFDETPASLKATRACLDALGLECTSGCICPPHANPISEHAAIRAAARDHVHERIDWAYALGASVMMGPFHSAIGQFVGRGPNSEEWGWCVDYLRDAGEYADQANLTLSVEPLNRFEAYFLNTAANSNRLVSEVGLDNVGYLYDSFHANIEEKSIYDSIIKNAVGINHIHISENDRGVPGTGHVHWADTFRGIRDIGYDRWLVIEAFGRALPELAAATCIWRDLFESEEALARDGLAFIKRMI